MHNSHPDNLLVHFRPIECLRQEASVFPSIDLNQRHLCDFELLLSRSFYQLSGYMGYNEYESVLNLMRLNDGTVWPIPFFLDVSEKIASGLKSGITLALRDEDGFLLSILKNSEIWKLVKQAYVQAIYGTDDQDVHPGVRNHYQEVQDWFVAGSLEGLHLPLQYDFAELRSTPAETHRLFAQRGWRKVAGFQTEEHLHCAHREMVLRAAREKPGLIFLFSLWWAEPGLRIWIILPWYAVTRNL